MWYCIYSYVYAMSYAHMIILICVCNVIYTYYTHMCMQRNGANPHWGKSHLISMKYMAYTYHITLHTHVILICVCNDDMYMQYHCNVEYSYV